MKKLIQSKIFYSVCTFLVAAAPILDIGTRCVGWAGEPNFPNESETK